MRLRAQEQDVDPMLLDPWAITNSDKAVKIWIVTLLCGFSAFTFAS